MSPCPEPCRLRICFVVYKAEVENLIGGHPGGEVHAVHVGEVGAEPHVEWVV